MITVIFLWILLGLAAGWIASLITRSTQGIIMDIVLGIIGAIIGGLLANLLGLPGITGFNLWSLIIATLGAIILILIGRFLS